MDYYVDTQQAKSTLPKALPTQALTALTGDFYLVVLVWFSKLGWLTKVWFGRFGLLSSVWFGRFGLVCLVWYVWFGMFGLVSLVW